MKYTNIMGHMSLLGYNRKKILAEQQRVWIADLDDDCVDS
jgi:uncharacterized protein YecT (DUF1311 family)